MARKKGRQKTKGYKPIHCEIVDSVTFGKGQNSTNHASAILFVQVITLGGLVEFVNAFVLEKEGSKVWPTAQ
jgi:hypothetical protein